MVVKDGKIVGEGLNESAKKFDPTSHGEVEAVRDACRNLKTTDLSGCELYTSCEPCSVCVSTMIMAGISRMYYGASLDAIRRGRAAPDHAAAGAAGARAGRPAGDKRSMPAEQKLGDEAIAVLKAWVKKQ